MRQQPLLALRRDRQRGLTLIEIMVALVMGLVLIAGIGAVFVANKQTYRYQESLSRLQENGRIALELIARDIRASGYTGCGGRSTKIKNTVNKSTSILFAFGDALTGFDSNVSYQAPTSTVGTKASWVPNAGDMFLDMAIFGSGPFPVENSDVISLRVVDPTRCKVSKHNDEAAVFFTTPCDLKKNEIVMVSDCSNAAILQIDNTTGYPSGGSGKTNVVHNAGVGGQDPGNWTKDLGHNYARNGGIFKIKTYTYYVADTGRGTDPASPLLGLYRVSDDAKPEELVEGVENMQFLYGMDGDVNGSADIYERATDSTPWSNVRSVRISLRLRAPDLKVLPKSQGFQLDYNDSSLNIPDASQTTSWGQVSDTAWRQVFTTTVNLRNRSS